MAKGKTQSGNILMAYSWPTDCPWRPGMSEAHSSFVLRTSSLHTTLRSASELIGSAVKVISNTKQGPGKKPGLLSEQAVQPWLIISIRRQNESCNTSSRVTGPGQLHQLFTGWNLRAFKHRCAAESHDPGPTRWACVPHWGPLSLISSGFLGFCEFTKGESTKRAKITNRNGLERSCRASWRNYS